MRGFYIFVIVRAFALVYLSPENVVFMKVFYRSLFLFFIVLGGKDVAAQTGWWTMPNVGLQGGLRFDDVFFFDVDTGLVVSGKGTICKTYDGASYWYTKLDVGGNVYFRSLEFLDDHSTGIAGSLSGKIYRSINGGETWVDISTAIADTGVYSKRICGLAHKGNTFWGVGWWGATAARIYKSTDAGQTWQTKYLDTNMATSLVDVTFLSFYIGFATGCRYYDGGKMESVVLKTTDGGDTWSKVFADTSIAGRIWKIQFANSDTGYASIESHFYPDTVCIIKTIDGGNSWYIVSVGSIPTTQYGTQGIGFLNTKKGWVGGYYSGMFETNDGGQSWSYLPIGNECNRYFKVDENNMYVSGDRVYRYGHFHTTGMQNQAFKGGTSNHLDAVMPNPSKGEINISFDIGNLCNVRLEIIALEGHRVYPVTSGYFKAGHYNYKWDGDNKPAGNYAVWLGTDEVPLVQKFSLVK